MLIPSLKLNNVIIFIDNNNLQSLEQTSKSHPSLYPIEKKFESFGWQSFKCNGHNIKKLYQHVLKGVLMRLLPNLRLLIMNFLPSRMSLWLWKKKPLQHQRKPLRLKSPRLMPSSFLLSQKNITLAIRFCQPMLMALCRKFSSGILISLEQS